MIDHTATTYDAPTVYLPKLIAWAEEGADHFTQVANIQRRQSFVANAMSYDVQAAEYREIARRARERLTDVSELTLADVQADEPPVPLVDLTAWLKAKLGRLFPWVPEKGWQTIGFVLMCGRPS